MNKFEYRGKVRRRMERLDRKDIQYVVAADLENMLNVWCSADSVVNRHIILSILDEKAVWYRNLFDEMQAHTERDEDD